MTVRKGRKRKAVPREKNGRIKRSIQPQRDIRMLVLSQPHRKGSSSDRMISPVGRLIEASGYLTEGLSKEGLYDAANRFSGAYQKWQTVVGSSRPYANSAAATDIEIDDEQADRFRKNWMDAWRALRNTSNMTERAVFIAVIDPQAEDWVPPYWVMYACIDGLKALAAHFGLDINGEDKEAPKGVLRAA